MDNKINALLNLNLENTKIALASFEDSGVFQDMTDLPPFYRVVLETSFSAGSYIKTELWLPEEWNGIFIGLGNGGMAGWIGYWSLREFAMKGYAVAQTDMGTSRGRNDGIGNPDMWKDFGWRATHVMAQISKETISHHYGEAAKYSYFIGGSTGGQQAFGEAQRFPHDFDGIIAGVPANNRVFLHTYFLWNHNHLRTRDGMTMFTADEVNAISASAADFFQTLGDGEKGDNFVSFPYNDDNTVEDFIGFLRNAHPEFTDAQLSALKAVYDGPKNPTTGKQIYNGMPIGSEIYDCGILHCQDEESPHYYPFIWTFGKDYNGYDFDFDKDLETLSDTLSKELNANDTDLSEFEKSGGKIIAYSGSADPCVPFPDAMQYYERVMEKCGGYDKTTSFFKYFLSPGKDHGEKGLGANKLWGCEDKDLLATMRLWREKGVEPQCLIAAKVNDGETLFERKIYPYASKENPKRAFPISCDEYYLNK